MKLIISNMEKFFKNKKVINDLSLTIDLENKNLIGLIGPNGAGKTTLMKTIVGILEHSNGRIEIENEEQVSFLKWTKQNTAYIPAGERTLKPKISVFDNVLYYAAIKGEEIKNVKNNINLFSKKLVIEDLLHRNVETLSTGQKKKVQLLCVLSTDKKLLLLDEPSSGLDIDSVYELQYVLNEIKSLGKQKIILSSHDVSLITEVADEYYFINRGNIYHHLDSKLIVDDLKKYYGELREH